MYYLKRVAQTTETETWLLVWVSDAITDVPLVFGADMTPLASLPGSGKDAVTTLLPFIGSVIPQSINNKPLVRVMIGGGVYHAASGFVAGSLTFLYGTAPDPLIPEGYVPIETDNPGDLPVGVYRPAANTYRDNSGMVATCRYPRTIGETEQDNWTWINLNLIGFMGPGISGSVEQNLDKLRFVAQLDTYDPTQTKWIPYLKTIPYHSVNNPYPTHYGVMGNGIVSPAVYNQFWSGGGHRFDLIVIGGGYELPYEHSPLVYIPPTPPTSRRHGGMANIIALIVLAMLSTMGGAGVVRSQKRKNVR